MLWTKDPTQNEAVYVDLFALNGGWMSLKETYDKLHSNQIYTTSKKNDEISLRKRNEGNEFFRNQFWNEAMACYNDSLRYAKEESANISLAYANRSACFLKMKLYNECLNDIELAKAAGYPEDLMSKLDRRKAECLKSIEEGTKYAKFVEPKLSFEPDEHFPCMANVLKIERDDNGELMVIAKEDIDVGQTVVIEKPFIASVYVNNERKCDVCLKERKNLVSCKKCTVAMFCSDQCQSSPLHKGECGFQFHTDSVLNGFYKQEIRTISMLINMFSSIDELMNFVEEERDSDPNEIPATCLDEKSKYREYLKLPTDSTYPLDKLTQWVFNTYKMAMDIPLICNAFQSLKHQRFLMHLIGQHIQISSSHSLPQTSSRKDKYGMKELLYSSTKLMHKYLGHSCAPNVLNVSCITESVYVTVRPVKRGEQLMYTLFEDVLTEPTKKRKERMLTDRNHVCTCTRCEGLTASPDQRQRLRSDTNFKYIGAKNRLTSWTDLKAKQAKCVAFLRRYDDVVWCDEIGIVVSAYVRILKKFLCYECSVHFLPEPQI